MFRNILDFVEERVAILAALVTRILAFIWVAHLAFTALFGSPLTFKLSSDKISPELVLPFFISLIGASALLWQVVSRWVLGISSGNSSYWLTYMAPKQALLGSALLASMVLWYKGYDERMWFLTGYVGYLSALAVVARVGPIAGTQSRRSRARTPEAYPTQAEAPPDVARSTKSKITFNDIYGNNEIKARLKEAADAIVAPRTDGKNARNGILLSGEPGNGKTVFAEALAGELKLPILQLSYADVSSQWVGEKTARINNAFAQARRQQPCVLFIDEVDSFLESRESGGGNGVKEDRDVVNALLTLMVDIRKEKVVLIAATNHIDRLDGAGIREGRFDFKVEITPPDSEARIGLLKYGLKTNLPKAVVDSSVIEAVARRWNGFSVKRILAVTEELPSYLKREGKSVPTYEDFMGALRTLQGRKGSTPENVKPMSEMVLSPLTREMLDLIVGRMADPEHTEANGGTLPTGVLFYGPPGTGKTATAKAVAREIDWAFLPATGADLARDAKALEKLYAKAKELRPCIIFVDEADELLRSRDYSPNTEATNKLLTLMDGVNDRVKDVVWVAATNNPEQIDKALLRGGRFTEKVLFERPSAEALGQYLESWFASRKVKLDAGLTVSAVGGMLEGQSIANAEAVAQAALNRAISRRSVPVVVTQADIDQAMQAVL